MNIEVCQGLNIKFIDFMFDIIYIVIYYYEMNKKQGYCYDKFNNNPVPKFFLFLEYYSVGLAGTSDWMWLYMFEHKHAVTVWPCRFKVPK